MNDDLEGLKD